MIITFPLVMFTTLASSFWRAKAKYDAPNRTGLTSIIITLILAYLLKSYGAFGVVASYSAGNMYSFFALVYPIRIEIINSFRGKFNLIKTIPFFKAGLIVTFISGLFSLLIWVNSTLLGVLGSYEDVARFGISSAIAGVILIIPTTLSLFMVTRASQIKDKTKALNVLHRVVRVSFFSSLMSSILLVTLLPWIIKIFFGKYQGIELPTSILIIGTVFFSSYYIIYSYYIGTMNSQRALLPVIAGFAVNIILSLILIPKLSLLGVSLSSSLAHLAILAYIAKNERMKRILVMSLIAILTIYLSSLNYVIGFIVLIVFVPISILLKIITKEDIKVIKEVVLKR